MASQWWTTENGLLPNVIKQRKSQVEPYFVFANAEGITEELTFTDIDNASDRAAWFLTKNLAEDEKKFFYMGRVDIRYFIWVVAAMKTGKCAVIPSSSNTVNANQLLFRDVGAKTLLHTTENFEIVEALHAATKDTIRWLETPKYEDLLSREKAEEFPFTKTFDELKEVPFAGLHTSGTTGHPKPIYWTHATVPLFHSQIERDVRPKGDADELQFEQSYTGKKCFTHFPWYHAGGMISLISAVVCGAKQLIAPAPGTRLTPENVTEIFKATRPDSCFMAPTVAENMLKYPPGLEALAQIKHVMYGGGPMNPSAGEKLAKVIPHLVSVIGSTEGGLYHLDTYEGSSHWNHFKFIDVGQKMEEVEPGLYELVFPRTPLVERTYIFFNSMPDLDEYRTKDLFSKVEGQPGWWTYRGRVDNWIAMSNGLKFDPKNMEDAITSHPEINAAILAGERRYRLCLLVELDESVYPAKPFESESEEKKWEAQQLAKLWPTIDDANHHAPKFGRVPKELVLFARRDKPFRRTPKGSIQRRLTVADYQQDIEDLYSQSEQGLLTHGLPPLKSTSAEDLLPFVRELYGQTLEYENYGDDDDAFSRGLDSFAVASLSSRLKAALRAYGSPEAKLGEINTRLLYSATTPRQLSAKLSVLLAGEGAGADIGENTDALELVDKYEAEVRKLVEQSSSSSSAAQQNGSANGHAPGQVVAVTGTTGSLGSYLLATLLARPDVSKVIALNRAADARERQPKALKSRGLPDLQPAIDQGRVVFFQMDVAKPRLGLGEDEYATLLNETTSIVHNAFPVNFLMTVRQFEPQYVGILSLLEVALHGRRQPSYLFISSIGASVRRKNQVNPVPEVVFERDEAKDLALDGYGAAKFVGERMAHQFSVSAAEQGRATAAAVLRVGQVSGPLAGDGAWNIWEWLPSVVVSSKFLNAAPATIGQKVDWIPVDELAKATSELVDAVEKERNVSGKTPVYNVLNPKVTTWDTLLPAVQSIVSETIPIGEWLERLEKTKDSSTHILDQNPGVKLVDFYKGFLTAGGLDFSTDELVRASPTAAKLGAIEQKDMKRWMQAWGLI
ncbi:hypothetical protein VPNG_04087 [Cytospora leucostoma]|uniref:Carrier domain-containing protein n=1 Tax=Cytospora leucostoma TaxID=1230097 RepID=A0A423XDD7_9PEZI|nr:hypothetical protein VPNG_04087 [Cytospora leucostoma]